MRILFFFMCAVLFSCADSQHAKREVLQLSFSIDSVPFVADWRSINAGSSEYYAEAADSSGLFGIFVSKNHQYHPAKAEFVRNGDSGFYRAEADSFLIQSISIDGIIHVQFSGVMYRNTDGKRITVSDGSLQIMP